MPNDMLGPQASRHGLAGFVLAGLLFSFPGPVLLAWDYHRSSDYAGIGLFFLIMNLGFLAAVQSARRVLRSTGIGKTLVGACVLAAASFALLALAGPPIEGWARRIGFMFLGFAAGLLNAAVFELMAPAYDRAPAPTVNLAGILFGLGCLTGVLLVGASLGTASLWLPMLILAAISGAFAVGWARASYPALPARSPLPLSGTVQGFRSTPAILFALLLFFQFGNEWAIAGWLALFLVQRVGASPSTALLLLALYWIALVVGRIAVQSLLPRVRHWKILLWSLVAALLGCIVLASTNNLFGAIAAVLFLGGGFAAVYPLVVEAVSGRFSYYHPVYFNGIFSFALTGGLLAPWVVGLLASSIGIAAATLLPLVGTLMVFVLLLLIWLEAKLNPVE